MTNGAKSFECFSRLQMDDTRVPNEEVPGLKVSVVSAEVSRPGGNEDFPQWSPFSTRVDVTKDKPTGQNPSDAT